MSLGLVSRTALLMIAVNRYVYIYNTSEEAHVILYISPIGWLQQCSWCGQGELLCRVCTHA